MNYGMEIDPTLTSSAPSVLATILIISVVIVVLKGIFTGFVDPRLGKINTSTSFYPKKM